MSTSTELYTQDPVVAKVANSLAEQISSMEKSASVIQGVTEQIESYFQSTASTAFRTAMSDWNDKYTQIISQYNTWLQDYQSGHAGINNAHEEARSIAGGFMSTANDVYGALSGN